MGSDYKDLNPSPRILLGPGPSMVHPRTLQAMAMPMLGYLDPEYVAIMDDVQSLLNMVFQSPDAAFTTAISGTGSAGMEASLANFIEEGDSVLIGVMGYFGERLVQIAERYGADISRVDAEWGTPIRPEQIEAALAAKPAKLVALVHGETSTGVVQPLEEIAEIVHRHGALLLVDTVASLGAVDINIGELGIDICYSGSQKCLSAPPGLAPLTVSQRAWDALEKRETPVGSWYFDLKLIKRYWGPDRAYHHTGPASLNYALREALRLIDEEGLDACIARHEACTQMLWQGLAEVGMEPYVAEESRLASLTTVRLPDGMDEANIRRRLRDELNIEVAGGLGALAGKVWRIGLMGYSARPENVVTLLGALRRFLN